MLFLVSQALWLVSSEHSEQVSLSGALSQNCTYLGEERDPGSHSGEGKETLCPLHEPPVAWVAAWREAGSIFPVQVGG